MPKRAKVFPAAPKKEVREILVNVDDLQGSRRLYGSRGLGIVIPGQVATPEGSFSQVINTSADESSHGGHVILGAEEEEEEDGDGDGEDMDTLVGQVDVPHEVRLQEAAQRANKRERQWLKWTEDVIPSMLQPYLSLLRETDSLRMVADVHNRRTCQGCSEGRRVNVACIFFDKIENVQLCTCTDLALQLLNRGLFPCAPTLPSLAVDLQMLDFVRELFVNAAPNTTAWCDTLESFLNARKFKLTTRNSLRTRFGNALHWYAALIDSKNARLRYFLNQVREHIATDSSQEAPENDLPGDSTTAARHGNENEAMDVDEEGSADESNESEGSQAYREGEKGHPKRPSEYLRDRCPLCFGGSNWHKPDEVVDAIVCIDACFTQKRRKSQGNGWMPPREHPESVFISPQEAKAMEAEVEEIRPNRPVKSRKDLSKSEAQREYEPGLRVPTTVLDECNDSFLAADANRVKASTQFFSDTGLMALLCRHDRVLFLVNMTSAGERQHYALALLKKLFEHIPAKMRVGLLYDIGCQLHRSCVKHGFLPHYLDRIVFGISVFHAYGHQWPCQLIYHPRKCQGFGLTDGEGCERFWSSIKLLIPSLRVSGYFNRIYTLDTQIKHLDNKSLLSLGGWLRRKWAKMVDRKRESEELLRDLEMEGITQISLREQWSDQVAEQTKPLKKQSSKLANKEIYEILTLVESIESRKEELETYQEMLDTGDYEDGLSVIEVRGFVEDLEKQIGNMRKTIAKKKGKLSVDGRLNLQNLINNEFLRKRMNALALKQRIRDRLRQRKFELANLERAYRKTSNHLKLEKHALSQIKRKEPTIVALMRKYNNLCKELVTLIHRKRAPRGAIAPVQMEGDRLFNLDVDDDIWQDVGLTDDVDGLDEIPPWLGQENVRKGIKALLELDRCNEEERRLVEERVSMQEWMVEEWTVVTAAEEFSGGDMDINYQLQQRQEYLLQLCVRWQAAVRVITSNLDNKSWGPSPERLAEWRRYEFSAQMDSQAEEDEGTEDLYFDNEDVEDAAFLDDVEAIALGDQYHYQV